MSVLVTGGSGYYGAHIALALLEAGEEVVVLDLPGEGLEARVPAGAAFVAADPADPAALADTLRDYDCSAVMHPAPLGPWRPAITPAELFAQGLGGSTALFAAALAAGVRHLVLTSTADVYGKTEAPAKEDHPRRPAGAPATVLFAVENALRGATAGSRTSHAVLRVSDVAGADPEGRIALAQGDGGLVEAALRAARTGRVAQALPACGGQEGVPAAARDLLHVSDMAQAHVLALRYLREGGKSTAFNCGSGFSASAEEIVAHVARATDTKLAPKPAARGAQWLRPLALDTGRAAKELGWSPQHSTLDHIVATTLNAPRPGADAPAPAPSTADAAGEEPDLDWSDPPAVEFALDRRRETPTGPWLRLLSLRGPAADPDHAHFRRIAGKARRRMPENFEVMVKIAAWAIDRNLLDFALETLKLVPFEHQGRPDVRVQTARLAIEMGDAQRGLKLAEHLTVPPTVQAFGLRLLALVELGRFRDALELVGEGIPDVRTIEWATFHLFEAYGASRHELPEFIEALETLAEAYFNDYTSTKIRLLTRARRYDMAVELCQGLIAECRSSEKAAVAVAEAYLRSGQWLQGRAALQAALEGLGQHPKMAREARQAIETLDMLEGFYRDAPHSVPRDYALPAALFEYLYLDRPAPEDTPPPVLDLALVAARLDRTPGSRTLLNARRAVWPQPGLETELWLQSAPAALPDDPLVRRGRAEDIAVLDGGAKVAAPYDRLPLNIARNVAALGQQIERRRPRILHAWQDAANLEAGLAGVAAGVDRIVLHSHNLQPDVPSADLTVPAFRRAYRALLSRPEVRFICSSHAAMAAYAKVLNLTPDPRHHVVHNGFDWSRAPDPAARAADGARLRAAHGLPADAVVVGGWCPLADHARPQLWIETAIRAAGHDARLHFLLGGAGPALPALQARVREFGLSNRILFAGDAQPAVKMAPAFDLLLHTPPFEALPTVPIEALGNAVPVIAPAFGGAFECVPPRSNLDALSLVEDDTAEAFVAALLRMHREGPGPEAMAKVAEEVRAYFSIPRMTRELYRIYTS